MSTIAPGARRLAISPYARRLARERGIAPEALAGSGPNGRVVAADVLTFIPRAAATPSLASGSAPASAFAATIRLTALRQLLAGFAEAETPFAPDDVILRAIGCALDDVPAATTLAGAPVALESGVTGKRIQLVFADIRKGSLAPLRARRLAALDAAVDQNAEPAALSLKLLAGSELRPVTMPLLAGRAMRLVLSLGETTAESLLCFDPGAVDEDRAAEVLSRFQGYLEVPLRLLA